MKHSLPITAVLVTLFLAAQIVGLSLVYLDQDVVIEDGRQVVQHQPTIVGNPPETEGWQSTLLVAAGVAIGTLLVLLLIRLRAFFLWKIWFFLAVWIALAISLDVLIPGYIALGAALALAVWKVFRPNPVVHNLTEIFVYAGIAILIARMFDLLWMSILLIGISLYDMWAVWKSKHMVSLAKAQAKSDVFAGLYIPKGKRLEAPPPPKAKKANIAVLGGGDIAFPLLFASVAMTWLVERGVQPLFALYQSMIIVACCTVALALLFAYSKHGKFYPAMPFLAAGCFAGLGIVILL